MSTHRVFLSKNQAEALQRFITSARSAIGGEIPPEINIIGEELQRQIVNGPSTDGAARCSCGGDRPKKKAKGTLSTKSMNWTPDCQRGGRKFIVVEAQESAGKNASSALGFFQGIMDHQQADYSHRVTGEWVANMGDYLIGSSFSKTKTGQPIIRLARRCYLSDTSLIHEDFVWMLSRMQLALAVIKLANANLKRRTITDIWRSEGQGVSGTGVTEGTWRIWINQGCVIAKLAAAGIRCSLVLQSDRGAVSWIKDRGGWGINIFMR
ncbi:hypothetical protein B0H16DRAFT_1490166 [Mycena metata]|uniref:Uncharacterized protein n=1 Tax=Mycena metata TaxID=1033252 RepID=A0AAD7KJJ9_9AGAR|nr:hypothetical protein B0H16DRAFT_1490166 [Mycena metata]